MTLDPRYLDLELRDVLRVHLRRDFDAALAALMLNGETGQFRQLEDEIISISLQTFVKAMKLQPNVVGSTLDAIMRDPSLLAPAYSAEAGRDLNSGAGPDETASPGHEASSKTLPLTFAEHQAIAHARTEAKADSCEQWSKEHQVFAVTKLAEIFRRYSSATSGAPLSKGGEHDLAIQQRFRDFLNVVLAPLDLYLDAYPELRFDKDEMVRHAFTRTVLVAGHSKLRSDP